MFRSVSVSGIFDINLRRRKFHERRSPMLARIMRMRLRGGLMGSRLRVVSLLLIILGTAGLGFVLYEMRTSRLQAKVLSDVATQLDYSVAPGPSHAIDFPKAGPYDERLGYVELPEITQRLHEQGFEIVAQARHSPMLRYVTRAGLFIPYEKKSQAGLQILDRNGQVIFATAYPGRLYSNFDAVPEILVVSLLFIENRELLDEQMPYKNPAVEWDRFAKAVVDMGIKQIKKDHEAPGGSTLATQIEKYQHSPGGRTPSGGEKIRQMASASLRAYLDGAETLEARRQLVVDYINSIPLGAVPGYGEIIGIGDGLWAWYGLELEAFNQLLEQQPDNAKAPNLAEWALAYKQMLSLLLAQRRPTFYLLESHESLEERTNSYVRALTNGGVLRPFERDAILKARLQVQKNQVLYRPTSFTERKAANAIRPRLLSLLGVEQLYELDRFDLTVQSTLDTRIQEEVTRKLRQLRDPAEAAAAGLNGYRILEQGDPAGVIYSFTLYERGDNVNLLRAQTDNFNQPLNINEGVKLELGSTAKLRTLITYLHIVSELHTHYAGLSNEALRAVSGPEADNLSRWAIAYLLNTEDRALRPMLMTAMERHYSASPHERFFTGGGQHTFSNYDRADNGRIMSVREAFHESVNLVFIRVMRDCVRYYMYQRPGIVELFENPEDPRREAYLIRFADKEGQVYQRRFYRKYQGKNGLEILELLAESISYPQPARYATVFRSVAPEGGIEAFSTFVRSHLPHSALSDEDLQELYDKYAITAFSLHDRGYIARIHPLELWTAAYLRANRASQHLHIRLDPGHVDQWVCVGPRCRIAIQRCPGFG